MIPKNYRLEQSCGLIALGRHALGCFIGWFDQTTGAFSKRLPEDCEECEVMSCKTRIGETAPQPDLTVLKKKTDKEV
jgi:hypothetical protein